MSRVTFATFTAFLLLAGTASASTTAAAGPSPTPLILEILLAAIVITGMAVRRPVSRALAGLRRALTPQKRAAAARARRV